MSDERKIGTGFGVMLLKDNKILLGKRHEDPEKAQSALKGAGTWTMPGGKLHFGETFEEGAQREVLEETGIILKSVKVIALNNDKVEDAHFITIGLLAEGFDGDAQIREPDEITKWEWFPLDNLPSPLYFPSAKVLDNYKKGQFYLSESNIIKSPKDDIKEKAHYISVTGIVKNKEDKYLIVKRNPNEKAFPNKWCFPGGKLQMSDFIDTPKDTSDHWLNIFEKTVEKEIKEETGLNVKATDYIASLVFVRPNGFSTVIVNMVCEYKEGNITLNQSELVDHAWVTLEEAKNYDLIENIYEQLEKVDKKTNNKKEDINLFAAAKAFINYDGKILLLQESQKYQDGTNVERFDVVGGRVKPGEKFEEGLLREIKEETGLDVAIKRPFYVGEWRPKVKDEQWHIIGTFFECEAISNDVKLSEDHSNFLWINPQDYLNHNIIDNLKPAFESYLNK